MAPVQSECKGVAACWVYLLLPWLVTGVLEAEKGWNGKQQHADYGISSTIWECLFFYVGLAIQRLRTGRHLRKASNSIELQIHIWIPNSTDQNNE